MIEKQDEQQHSFGPHRYWNESWYFNFMSQDQRWGGATRIGFSPNQSMRDGFIILYLPDGSTGFIRTCDAFGTATRTVACEQLQYECVLPFECWRMHYAGPLYVFSDSHDAAHFHKITLHALPARTLKIDLEFRCYHKPFDFHNAMKIRPLPLERLWEKLKPGYFFRHLPLGIDKLTEIRTMKGAQHYEQAGHVCGTISLDGEAHEFTGTGQRDHSWGVRDMRMISQWQWFSCQFGDDMAFNVTRVETLAIAAVGGHVWYRGACRPLQSVQLDVKHDATGRWARAFSLTLKVADLPPFHVQGTTRTNFPVQLTTEGLTAIVNEGLAEFTWNQQRTIGISEFMGQVYP